jgi:predicted nuclease with TOPRIM domain
MEELIKQKEKAAQEVNNNRTKLESRCQELESRNYELEQTVKTLMKRIESLELTNIHDNRSETNKGNSGAKNDANFSCNNDSFRISLIELPQVLMFLQLYEVNLILFSRVSLFNIDVCSFEEDCCSLQLRNKVINPSNVL